MEIIEDLFNSPIKKLIAQYPDIEKLVKQAALQSTRKIPIKQVIVSLKGEILENTWLD